MGTHFSYIVTYHPIFLSLGRCDSPPFSSCFSSSAMRAGRAGPSTKKKKNPNFRSRIYVHEETASQISKASTSTRSGQLRFFTSASPIVAPPAPLQDEEMVDSFYPSPMLNEDSPAPCPSGITVTIPAKRYVNSVRRFPIECMYSLTDLSTGHSFVDVARVPRQVPRCVPPSRRPRAIYVFGMCRLW